MPAATKVKQTNDLGYYEIDWAKFRPMGERILVQWEESNDDIKMGGVILVRPDTHRKIHYTGIVKAVGSRCESGVKVGDRVMFDQFSQFEKFWDNDLGRMALISESQQGSAFAIIPPRVKIGGGEEDYKYEQ